MRLDWQRDGYCILCRNLEIEQLNSIYDIRLHTKSGEDKLIEPRYAAME